MNNFKIGDRIEILNYCNLQGFKGKIVGFSQVDRSNTYNYNYIRVRLDDRPDVPYFPVRQNEIRKINNQLLLFKL